MRRETQTTIIMQRYDSLTLYDDRAELYMGNSTLVIPQRPFLNIAANAPTANNDTSSDSSHRREYL